MARDYRAAKKQKPAARTMGSWLSFVSGLGIGLGVAVLVFLWQQHPSHQVATEAPPAAPTAAPDLPAVDTPDTTPTNTNTPANTSALPKFDFYKILPEIEVKVPEAELNAPAAPPAAKDAATNNATAATAYLLQIGSYQKFEEADQAKAQLALQGIQATIQRVVIKGSDVWFRVHVGPYKTLQEVQRARANLARLGVTAIVLKLGNAEP
jgi:cell division protein FtsN